MSPPLLVVNNCDSFTMQIGGFPYSLLVGMDGDCHSMETLDGDQLGESYYIMYKCEHFNIGSH